MATFEQVARARRSCRQFRSRPVSRASLDRLLEAGQGITSDDGRRSVPSPHRLYPLRLLIVSGRIESLNASTYTFDPESGGLVDYIDADIREVLQQVAIDHQPWIGQAAGIITICADMDAATQAFIDQPPYGQRGQRYAWIEAGAAAQNIQLQAAAEGLGSVLVAGFHDEGTSKVLGLKPPVTPLIHLCFGWPKRAGTVP